MKNGKEPQRLLLILSSTKRCTIYTVKQLNHSKQWQNLPHDGAKEQVYQKRLIWRDEDKQETNAVKRKAKPSRGLEFTVRMTLGRKIDWLPDTRLRAHKGWLINRTRDYARWEVARSHHPTKHAYWYKPMIQGVKLPKWFVIQWELNNFATNRGFYFFG